MRKISLRTVSHSPNAGKHTSNRVSCQEEKPPNSIIDALNIETDHSSFELKMFWRFRWFIVYLYASALILSIVVAAIIAIVTRNVISSIIPTSLLLAMKPIIQWAFYRQTSGKLK